MQKKRNILLSTWISISFILAVIGIVIIQYGIQNKMQSEEEIRLFQKISQCGNILTIIGIVSTFISLITSFVLTRKIKDDSDTIKQNVTTLTKVFAITFALVALVLFITDIIFIARIKALIDFDKIIYLSHIRGIFLMISTYTLPIFAIIETILIFIATKKEKQNTTK